MSYELFLLSSVILKFNHSFSIDNIKNESVKTEPDENVENNKKPETDFTPIRLNVIKGTNYSKSNGSWLSLFFTTSQVYFMNLKTLVIKF